jgi:glycosyltransferase involved in cell wall biosynthesis
MDNLTIQDKAKPKISVIIPVYNTEKYLEASVRSVMNQTYSNLEIICVNDGSTDGSLDILNRLKAEDDRIVVLTKENGGLGDTRNYGIAHSSCEWLSFLDSDDTLEPNAFETISEAFEYCPDMIHFGIRMLTEDGSEVSSNDVKYYDIRYEGLHNLTDSMILHVDVSAADKLFRRSIINRYNLHFEKIYFEDYQFSMQYMSVIRTVYYFKNKLYNYLRRGGSIMNQTFAKTPRAIDHLRSFDYFCAFVYENRMNEEFRRLLSKSFIACYSFAIRYTTPDMLPEVVDYATELYRRYGVLNKRLDRVIENRTVKFASTRKNGWLSFYVQKLFALRYEYVDYKLYKVLKIFGIIVYKIPKN